jgi:hypothetical protein
VRLGVDWVLLGVSPPRLRFAAAEIGAQRLGLPRLALGLGAGGCGGQARFRFRVLGHATHLRPIAGDVNLRWGCAGRGAIL